MFRRLLLPLCLLAALSSASYALDIKGLHVDQPLSCTQLHAIDEGQPTWSSRGGRTAADCNDTLLFAAVSFGNGTALMMVQQSEKQVLLSVTLTGFDFNDTLAALTVKFGRPKITETVIHNRMNAAFEQTTAEWVDGDVRLRLKMHGITIGKPVLQLFGKQGLKDFMEKKENAAANAASKL